MVEALLKRHQEQADMLADVETDQEVVDDAVTVHGHVDAAPFGLTSETMTHYTFERFLDQTQVPPGGHERVDWEEEANDFVDATIAALGIDMTAGAAAATDRRKRRRRRARDGTRDPRSEGARTEGGGRSRHG